MMQRNLAAIASSPASLFRKDAPFPSLLDLCIEVLGAYECLSLEGVPVNIIARILASTLRQRRPTLDDAGMQVFLCDSSLRALHLYGCQLLTDAGCVRAVGQLPDLVYINLANVPDITNKTVQALAKHCRSLTSLDVSGNLNVTEFAIQRVAASCSALVGLRLNGCVRISDRALQDVAEHCPRLAVLEVRGCQSVGDRGVAAIVRKCHQLRELDLSKCVQVTHSALWDIVPRLRQLQRGWPSAGGGGADHDGLGTWDDQPWGALDDTDLVTGCPHLSRLVLAGCVRLEDSLVRRLAGLRHVNLRDCFRVGALALQQMVRGCASLRTLRLRGCTQVTDSVIQTVSKHCTGLEELDVSWCPKVSDVSLRYLCAIPRLRALNVAYCRDVGTWRALDAFTHASTALSCLNLAECTRVDDRALAAIMANGAALRTVCVIGTAVPLTTAQLAVRYPHVDFLSSSWMLVEDDDEQMRALSDAWLHLA